MCTKCVGDRTEVVIAGGSTVAGVIVRHKMVFNDDDSTASEEFGVKCDDGLARTVKVDCDKSKNQVHGDFNSGAAGRTRSGASMSLSKFSRVIVTDKKTGNEKGANIISTRRVSGNYGYNGYNGDKTYNEDIVKYDDGSIETIINGELSDKNVRTDWTPGSG